MHHFKHVILELLFEHLLHVNFNSQIGDFIGQSLLPHPEIIDNQRQVLIDTVEVLELRAHLVRLLIQFLNFDFSWPNVSLKFLDLIVEHEFEFFKLLSLFLKLQYATVLLTYGVLALLNFILLSSNLISHDSNLLHDVYKLRTLKSDVFEVAILCLFGDLKSLNSESQVRLVLHSSLDDPC